MWVYISWTDHLTKTKKRSQIFFKEWYHVHKACEGQWKSRATIRKQCQGPGAKTTEVEACRVACVCFFISYLNYGLWQASVMYNLHSRDSAHDLLGPCMCPSLVYACMCNHSNCPYWQWTVMNSVAIYGLYAMIIANTLGCLAVLAQVCPIMLKHLPENNRLTITAM